MPSSSDSTSESGSASGILHVHVGGVTERAHSEAEGLHQHDDPSQQGNPPDYAGVKGGERPPLYGYRAVGPADGDGHVLLTAYHHAFKNGLTAVGGPLFPRHFQGCLGNPNYQSRKRDEPADHDGKQRQKVAVKTAFHIIQSLYDLIKLTFNSAYPCFPAVSALNSSHTSSLNPSFRYSRIVIQNPVLSQ